MSKPTIRAESCRGDGRCPECGAPSEFLHLLPCGCKPCMLWPCALEHLDRLLTESLRQLSEQRHPCPCGKDTASIKWARCYSCRQQEAEERERIAEERDAAIRERDEFDQLHRIAKVKIGQLEEDLSLARAHDAQPYPTAEAYERVCAALEATKRSLEQTRAAMEAGDLCTVCAGTGKPVSGKPCICGGHGGIGNQIIGLTREALRERERAEKAEALLRESLPHSYPHRHPTDGSDTLTARIREALPK